MEDPNITMEEYIKLEEEKSHRRAIVFNDELTSEETLSCEPTISSLNNNKIDFRISFDESDDEDYTNEFPAIVYNDALKFKSDSSTKPVEIPHRIDEFDLKNKTSLSECDKEEQNVVYFNDLFRFNIIFPDDLGIRRIDLQNRMIHLYNLCIDFVKIADMALPPRDQRHQYLTFEGLGYTDVNITDFEERLGRIYGREIHRVQFQLGGVRCRMSWRQFILGLGLHPTEEMESARFGAYWADSSRQITDKGDLSAYWVGISSMGDFLGTTPSYTSIKDPMLRLCHRVIACSIAGRSQAYEKVTVTDYFYLRGNGFIVSHIPNFCLELEVYRLQGICEELDDPWAWVASRPERQPDAAAGALVDARGAPDIDEGAQAILVPTQAPQTPLAAGPARTMAQRLARVDEEVHEIRGALYKQHQVIDAMARDLSKSTCGTGGITQALLDICMEHLRMVSEHGTDQRRGVRQRTGKASTSAALLDEDQPDP
ncbi:hypothetical protein Tco_0307938 [Tanacetum coccineum]